ncbi:DNA primase [Rhodococcus phage NiceHouse]|nr:DNA primase [Rhodococcus phage NiceHouse]
MARQWSTTTEKSTTAERPHLTEGQVRSMLEKIGLDPQVDADTHYMILCPFHANYHSAACSVAKDTGFFMCFNASCNARGEFSDLLEHTQGWNIFKTRRFMLEHEGEQKTYDEIIEEIYASSEEMVEFPASTLEKMRNAYAESTQAKDYMHWRGFDDDTLEYFQVGYDPNRRMVVVPMVDNTGRTVGVIGRTIAGEKRFKNSKELPTKKTLFNINNAKRAGSDYVVLVESSYDAMRIHQSGYPNVCATLGGTYSEYHVSQINRHFDGIILMTDSDEAGIKFAEKIARKSRNAGLAVFRGMWSETELFPNGAKDVCDQDDDGNLLMTEKEIAYCIGNKEMFIV